jgi:16S rRNA processing protein RimM
MEALPEPEEGSFYVLSLMGMEVRDAEGTVLGAVAEIYNFGAGDVVAVKENNGEENLYAFTHQNFPVVNEQERFVVLNKPEEI